MKSPLVSIIVASHNNHETLNACLRSVAGQTYTNTGLIVVDNNSTDDTKDIARRYTKHVYNKGTERSAQRNYGVAKAKGDFVLIIDSDMELSPTVVQSCVEATAQTKGVGAVIIPEESFGQGFWAQCKRLERTFYVGVDWIEAARFFDRKLYLQLKGYNEDLVSGEDWDLSQRVHEYAQMARIDAYIFHNEAKLKLVETLRKKYYYAQKFSLYMQANSNVQAIKSQTGPITRYKLFFSRPLYLFRNPLQGVGMLFMKTCEFAVGAIGYISTKYRQDKAEERA